MFLNLPQRQCILVSCIGMLFGCGKPRTVEPHYLRVVDFGPADSTNDYNKGVGLSRYVHINFNNDSIVYYALADLTGSQLHTYAGEISNLIENDTIQKGIEVIRRLSTMTFGFAFLHGKCSLWYIHSLSRS
jgi:hypothetical protein